MPADRARIAIARDLLTQLGVSLADLHDAETPASSVPTLADYLPSVVAAAGPGANRTYSSYWNKMATAWGTRPLDQITASDIEAMQHQMATTARSRRNSRHGRHAGEHVIAAARAIYTRAIADGHIAANASPAHRVAKLRRLPSTRRALTTHEFDQINLTARTSGNDVILDALLLRLHTETACRRGGALALRRTDLDTDNCLVQLREKGSTVRWQPISPALTASLSDHAASRGALLPTDQLLRYRDGHALTSRRYDHLWLRLGQRLPWVAGPGITTYIKADLHAVATALSALTGQPHPLTDHELRSALPMTPRTAARSSRRAATP
jgi:site-specific recombinase XerD